MLLTISTTQRPATDLSSLLHADPDDVRSRRFPFGEALVFFPQYDHARCTAAVLVHPDLDAGPSAHTQSSPSPNASWLAIVLATMFDQALQGRRIVHPGDRSARFRRFEVQVPVLGGADDEDRAHRLFAPLGYEIGVGDDGSSLWLTTITDLASLLGQLCVLLPVLDDAPLPDGHEVVDRLLAEGEPWLVAHPEGALVARRYLGTGEASAAPILPLVPPPPHRGARGARRCTRHLRV